MDQVWNRLEGCCDPSIAPSPTSSEFNMDILRSRISERTQELVQRPRDIRVARNQHVDERGAIFMIADSQAKGRCAFLHTDISLRAESIMHHATTKRMTFVCVYRFDNCIVFDCIFIHSSACCHLLSPQGFCAQLTTPSTLPLLAYDVHPSSSEGCAFRELRLKR